MAHDRCENHITDNRGGVFRCVLLPDHLDLHYHGEYGEWGGGIHMDCGADPNPALASDAWRKGIEERVAALRSFESDQRTLNSIQEGRIQYLEKMEAGSFSYASQDYEKRIAALEAGLEKMDFAISDTRGLVVGRALEGELSPSAVAKAREKERERTWYWDPEGQIPE